MSLQPFLFLAEELRLCSTSGSKTQTGHTDTGRTNFEWVIGRDGEASCWFWRQHSPQGDHWGVGAVFAMSSLKYYPGTSEGRPENFFFFCWALWALLESPLGRITGWDSVVNSENCLYLKQMWCDADLRDRRRIQKISLVCHVCSFKFIPLHFQVEA